MFLFIIKTTNKILNILSKEKMACVEHKTIAES